MVRQMIVASIITSMMFLSSCAFKEYNPNNPREYSDYWNNEENRKSSPAYPFTSGSGREWERDRKGPYGQ